VNDWLATRADALAEATGIDRAALDLTPEEIDTLLDLAAAAAHESGARTTAPLFCYLLGRARAHAASLDELDRVVRSTS
jgi:Domain of unknown function (DUF6457)